MSKTEALKLVRAIMSDENPQIVFTRHALEEMANDDLDQQDVWNILASDDIRITDEPESSSGGNYKYRVKTNRFCVVVAFFRDATGMTVITVWKTKRG